MNKVRKRWIAATMALALFCAFLPQLKSSAAEDSVDIQILATSDQHGKFYPYDYALNEKSLSGSSAQIATKIKELRNDNTLVIDVGDTVQGNSNEIFNNDSIHPMIQSLNLMNYDIWTTGNHEYNFGVPTLERFIKQFNGKTLIGNVYDKNDKPLADAYTIIEKGGVKIAVIGVVTPNIVRWDSVNLKDYKVTDPVEETKKVIEKVEDDVDLIVVAAHMSEGNEYGVENSGANALADACPEIDLIIAAHEHKLVEGVERNGVLIVENKDSAQTLARIVLTLKKDASGKYQVSDRKSESISMTDVTPDPTFMKELASADKKARDDANTPIGKLEGGNLVATAEIPGIPQPQIAPSALLTLINDVQRYYTDADISAAAMFSENADLKEGVIKKSDASLAYKYTNTLYKVEITGAQLKKYMEWSASYFNTFKDGDLTISFNPDVRMYNFDVFSGVNYDINISRPAGSRIENLSKPDGTAIKDSDVFVMAVNNYRANSHLSTPGAIFKEGEDLPKTLEIDVRGELGGIRELIGDYIVNVKGGTIHPTVENNWKITGYNWDQAQHEKVASLVKAGTLEVPRSEDGRTPNIRALTAKDLEAADGISQESVSESTTEVLVPAA